MVAKKVGLEFEPEAWIAFKSKRGRNQMSLLIRTSKYKEKKGSQRKSGYNFKKETIEGKFLGYVLFCDQS